MEELLVLLKETCLFSVTKNDLMHPTSDFVIKVYSTFLHEFVEKIQFLAGNQLYPMEINENMDPECLYKNMYPIMARFGGITFLLCDILEPIMIRTKNFMKICFHVLSFSESILDEIESLQGDIIKMNKNSILLQSENTTLISQIEESEEVVYKLSETKSIVCERLVQINHNYDEVIKSVESNNNYYLTKQSDIDNLERQNDSCEQDLIIMKNKKNDLLKQVVSEEEHQNLLKLAEQIKTACESICTETVNLNEVLSEENNEILYYQNIRKRLPLTNYFDIATIEAVIISEDKIKCLMSKNDILFSDKIKPLKQVKEAIKEQLPEQKYNYGIKLEEYKELQEQYLVNKENCYQKITKAKIEQENVVSCYNLEKVEVLKDIKITEKNLDTLRSSFRMEYAKIANIEAAVKEYFITFLHNL